MKWTLCGCACDAPAGSKSASDSAASPRSFWKRTWKWWTASLLALIAGAGIAYYVLFVPSAEYVAQKSEIEAKQQSLDSAFGPAPTFENDESAETTKEGQK